MWIRINNMQRIILLILISINHVFAQNLVPNGNFESYISCPTFPAQFQVVNNWYNPSVYPSTPDYYNQCAGTVPASIFGYQLDHSSGGAYAGIYGYGINQFYPNPIEYIQVELLDTLINGSKYYIEYFLSLAQWSGIAITDMGAYLSDTAMYLTTITNFPVSPSIENPDSIFLSDSMNWMHVSEIYIAHGGEKYLTIGNFRDSSTSHKEILDPNGYQFAYYLIDDVSIIDYDSVTDVNEIPSINTVNFYPNPSSDAISIESNQKLLSINILNILGCSVLEKNINVNRAMLNIGTLPKGIYFLQIITSDGKVVKKFVKE